jgi:hypothetical protein
MQVNKENKRKREQGKRKTIGLALKNKEQRGVVRSYAIQIHWVERKNASRVYVQQHIL